MLRNIQTSGGQGHSAGRRAECPQISGCPVKIEEPLWDRHGGSMGSAPSPLSCWRSLSRERRAGRFTLNSGPATHINPSGRPGEDQADQLAHPTDRASEPMNTPQPTFQYEGELSEPRTDPKSRAILNRSEFGADLRGQARVCFGLPNPSIVSFIVSPGDR